MLYPFERMVIVQYNYHERIVNLDETGFGIINELKPRPYTPAHWHKAVEVVYFVRGTVICKFSHGTIHGEPGQMYVINSHDVHETRCSRDAEYLVVHIQPSVMCRYVANFDMLHFSLAHDPLDDEKVIMYRKLREHMEQIRRQMCENSESFQLQQHARLFDITAILVDCFSTPLAIEETQLFRSDMNRLEPVLEHIQLHHDQELSLDWAADTVGLAKEYFCRLFKKNMGISYLQYLNQVRAAAVCKDLEFCDDSIGEIAQRHGFTDNKMMNRYFRELYGCTPSEKRKFFREMKIEI